MFLTIAEQVYKLITQQIAKKYDSKNRVSVRYSVPVISIGNISVGGTGKTPMAALVGTMLQEAQKKVALVSRGYGRKSTGLVVVANGKKIVCNDSSVTGDEPLLLAKLLPESIVVCHEKRGLGCQKAIELGAECIILDDGFQHRKVYRDCDIVLIDAKTLADKHLLPKGRLREPHSALQRADILVGTGGVNVENLQKLPLQSTAIRCSVKPAANKMRYLSGTEKERWLAVSGIANPDRFLTLLKDNNFQILNQIALKDHVVYKEKIVKNLITEANRLNAGIITTEKDAVKLEQFVPDFKAQKITLAVLPLVLQFTEGEEKFRNKILSII